jgi:hypothetical protein
VGLYSSHSSASNKLNFYTFLICLFYYLQQAESALSEFSQSSSLQDALCALNKSLVQTTLLRHRDKDVKLLVGVCFIEVMRVLAPDPPFSDENLKVFNNCAPLLLEHWWFGSWHLQFISTKLLKRYLLLSHFVVIENNFHEITLSNTQLIVFQEIFRIFISIFADLAETSSPYLTRRMKILENVAALKCSIIMFDIDCEDLALDMVKIFFSSMK